MATRLGSLAVTAALLIGVLPSSAAAQIREVRADAEWILSAQEPDGAIRVHPDGTAIWPYLANYAAIGLARASVVTADPRYADAAWRWLRWYQAHQEEGTGFVTDYDMVGGLPVSTGRMDSTDAYAGTFLVAVEAVWRATGHVAELQELAPGLTAAVDAIEATQDRDGLTWAKPGWPVKYLMDQAETYAGLRAAQRLAVVLADEPLAARAALDGRRMRRGVARLWDRRRGAYAWAQHADGARDRTNWRVLYPDALQQAWSVAFGLVERRRAAKLIERFLDAQPRWDRPAARARYSTGAEPVGYWMPVAWALQRTGQRGRAGQGAERIRRAAVAAGRRWPFTVGDAGQLLAGGSGPPRSPR